MRSRRTEQCFRLPHPSAACASCIATSLLGNTYAYLPCTTAASQSSLVRAARCSKHINEHKSHPPSITSTHARMYRLTQDPTPKKKKSSAKMSTTENTNPGNFANRPAEEVKAIASMGGKASHGGHAEEEKVDHEHPAPSLPWLQLDADPWL